MGGCFEYLRGFAICKKPVSVYAGTVTSSDHLLKFYPPLFRPSPSSSSSSSSQTKTTDSNHRHCPRSSEEPLAMVLAIPDVCREKYPLLKPSSRG